MVEPLGVLNLIIGEALSPHGHVVAVQDGADGSALDPEHLGQLVVLDPIEARSIDC